nr:unnamed protein product [uncultured bacterium]
MSKNREKKPLIVGKSLTLGANYSIAVPVVWERTLQGQHRSPLSKYPIRFSYQCSDLLYHSLRKFAEKCYNRDEAPQRYGRWCESHLRRATGNG